MTKPEAPKATAITVQMTARVACLDDPLSARAPWTSANPNATSVGRTPAMKYHIVVHCGNGDGIARNKSIGAEGGVGCPTESDRLRPHQVIAMVPDTSLRTKPLLLLMSPDPTSEWVMKPVLGVFVRADGL
jgi:hypothetical protein